jgi:hypothetical protein
MCGEAPDHGQPGRPPAPVRFFGQRRPGERRLDGYNFLAKTFKVGDKLGEKLLRSHQFVTEDSANTQVISKIVAQ